MYPPSGGYISRLPYPTPTLLADQETAALLAPPPRHLPRVPTAKYISLIRLDLDLAHVESERAPEVDERERLLRNSCEGRRGLVQEIIGR